MSKTMTRIVSLLLVLVMALSVCLAAVSCDTSKDEEPAKKPDGEQNQVVDNHDPSKSYTYKTATTALGSNWNPHAWETSADDSMLAYISSPFVDMSIKDSEKGVYQWVYEMATAVTDVTAANQGDLTKYPVNLPDGKTAADITEGYVYEIKLNPNAKWENGEKITADDYVESFKRLLDPAMKNYRANLYYDGESAVAGGFEYYYSTDAGVYVGVYSKYATIDEAIAAGDTVYLDMHGFWGLAGAKDEAGNACPQWVSITDTVKYQDPADGSWVSAADIYGAYAAYLANGQGYESYVSVYEVNEDFGATWDVVGMYKVDEYTIRYVCDAYLSIKIGRAHV